MTRRRSKERGSIVVVAMLVMVALIALGGLATLSARGGIQSSGHDRFKTAALYAAESGAAIAMDYLRRNVDATRKWRDFLEPGPLVMADPSDPLAMKPLNLPGNGILPGMAGNFFSPEMKIWYEVVFVNNRDDAVFPGGTSEDGLIIIRSTGHAPGGTVAQIEWTVAVEGAIGLRCGSDPSQKNGSAANSGRDDCQTRVNDTTTQTTTTIPALESGLP